MRAGRVSKTLSPADSLVAGNGRVLLSHRRLRILRELVERTSKARTEVEACAIAAATLGENAHDFAFALIYLFDAEKKCAHLSGSTQPMNGISAAPETIELAPPESAWYSLHQAAETGKPQRVTGLDAVLGPCCATAGLEPAVETWVLAIPRAGHAQPAGFLLAGLSPRLLFNDDYRGFLEIAAANIAAAIGNVRADGEKRKRAQALAELERSRVELATMRREVEEMLDDSKRRKSEFFANMSHEIRSPMTAILGYSDILLLHLQDPDDVECVKTIQESGNYLLEIINDILDLSKIEAGKLRINKEKVALQALLREIQSIMMVRAKKKGLRLILRCEGELPESIETDRARLRQILIHLLSNAIKFTEIGGVELIAKLQPDKSLMQIDVVDTGIGISPELQNQLFEAFTQGDSSATRRYGGTGLGLTISRRLVEMLDGALTFKSAAGQGSRFTVTVPIGRVDGASRRDFGKSAVFSVAPNTTLNGRRVLVTDDRTEIRYLLRQFLEDAGADVITAANGLAAIDDVQKSKSAGPGIDMVVMDMAMPGVDGYETTRRLRDKGYDKPIVALTAGATREDRDRCLQAGCNAYLTKPVDRQAFVDTVAHYAGDRGEGRANEKTALKILLVDDHRTACQSMARLLEMSGNEVRMAFDGKTAIAAAQNFPADALILDIKLPDMSGYELLKRLKENASLSAARSIALTGYTEEMRDKEASENFDHFLVKPVDILRLEALLT